MLTRVMDPLVLGPLFTASYLIFLQGWGDPSPAMKPLLAGAIQFLIGFSFSSWLESDPNEETGERSKKIANMIFSICFGIFAISLIGSIGYLLFFELNDGSMPNWLMRTLQIGYCVLAPFIVLEFVRRYLRFRKGAIRVQLEREINEAGEVILAAVELHAKREMIVEKATATLVGCVRERKSGHNHSYVEEVPKYEDQQVLSFPVENHRGTKSFSEVIFDTTNQKLIQLMKGDNIIHWHIQVNVECTGVDLSHRQEIELELPEHLDDGK